MQSIEIEYVEIWSEASNIDKQLLAKRLKQSKEIGIHTEGIRKAVLDKYECIGKLEYHYGFLEQWTIAICKELGSKLEPEEIHGRALNGTKTVNDESRYGEMKDRVAECGIDFSSLPDFIPTLFKL